MTSSSNRTLERIARRIPIPEPAYERLLRRRDRKRRNQRIAAGVVGIGVFLAAVWIVSTGGPFGRAQKPAGSVKETEPPDPADVLGIPPRGVAVRGNPPARGVPKVDYVIDLNTDVMTPLPEAIIRTAGETAEGSWPGWLPSPRRCQGVACGDARYVASPDGSLLAYVGTGDEGTPQIFIAGIDGTGVRQMTHDPTGAISPAWSPDGTMIAYATVAGTRDGFTGLFVLDVATGESRQVTDGPGLTDVGLQFTPGGSSLLYTGVNCPSGCLRTVPIAGGPSTVLIGPGTDAWEFLSFAANGSLSPDGTLVTFFGGGAGLGDPGPFVANADGTGLRALYSCFDAIPAGTWSPDGSRIACNEALPPTYKIVVVVDVATGDVWRVAKGRAATWLDDHTLLVER
jgi:hypothetical protein